MIFRVELLGFWVLLSECLTAQAELGCMTAARDLRNRGEILLQTWATNVPSLMATQLTSLLNTASHKEFAILTTTMANVKAMLKYLTSLWGLLASLTSVVSNRLRVSQNSLC